MVEGAIPQWEGDLFVAALRGERLWRLELNASGEVVDREKLLDGEVGRVRDVIQAPDGSLWVSTSDSTPTVARSASRTTAYSPRAGRRIECACGRHAEKYTGCLPCRPRPLRPRAVGRG